MLGIADLYMGHWWFGVGGYISRPRAAGNVGVVSDVGYARPGVHPLGEVHLTWGETI